MSNKIPPALVRRLSEDPEFDLEAFQKAHESPARATSIRLNPRKPLPTSATRQFGGVVPWCSSGVYLEERPVFTLDPFFHAGCYYVQEASSMFVAHVLQDLKLDREPLIALDLCAAPGGKSTLLNAHLHPDSLLVANEPIKSRKGSLMDNLIRWGYPNTIVTHSDSSAFGRLPGYFDLMLVDAPCSGSGMLRKDTQALDNWSEAAVKLCRERQQRILSNSISCLKADGYLIYSTCSYSPEENEEIADWLVETHGMEAVGVAIDRQWGIKETRSPAHHCPGYRFYPNSVQGEGFFLAVFRKPRHLETSVSRPKTRIEKNVVEPGRLSGWLEFPSEFFNFLVGDTLHVFPERHKAHLVALKKALYVKSAGVAVGKLEKDKLAPDHGLAMSFIRKDNFPRLELDLDNALNFLRKLTVPASVNEENVRGWMLVTHEGVALGWAKAIPGRINNYYPKEWRILHL